MASRDTTFRLRNRPQYVSSGRPVLRCIIRRASEDGVRLIDYGEDNALYKRELASGFVSGMVVTVAARAPGLFRRAWRARERQPCCRLRSTRWPARRRVSR